MSTTKIDLSYQAKIGSGVTSLNYQTLSADSAYIKLKGLADGTDPQDAVTKNQLELAQAGLNVKISADIATTGSSISLVSAPAIIDQVTLQNLQRILVKNQTSAVNNGVYIFHGAGSALTRAVDFDGTPSNEVKGGDYLLVTHGSSLKGSGWVVHAEGSVVVGVDPINFDQFRAENQYTGGNGINILGTEISVDANSNEFGFSTGTLNLNADVVGNRTFSGGSFTVNSGSNAVGINAASQSGTISIGNSSAGALLVKSGAKITLDTGAASTLLANAPANPTSWSTVSASLNAVATLGNIKDAYLELDSKITASADSTRIIDASLNTWVDTDELVDTVTVEANNTRMATFAKDAVRIGTTLSGKIDLGSAVDAKVQIFGGLDEGIAPTTAINIQALANTASGVGGAIAVKAGNAEGNYAGGAINVTSGDTNGKGVDSISGAVNISSGNGKKSGNVNIDVGTASSIGVAGDINIGTVNTKLIEIGYPNYITAGISVNTEGKSIYLNAATVIQLVTDSPDGARIFYQPTGTQSDAIATTDYVKIDMWADKTTPAGSLNSSNMTFVLSKTPYAGSEHIYLNGLLQDAGGQDYTLSGSTITFTFAPKPGDKLRASFRKNTTA
jgi:hypothetical protein